MLKTLKKHKAPYLFIMPFFILFIVFQLIPNIWTFYISLTKWNGVGSPEFTGIDNYKRLMVDSMFWDSLTNTVIYWITALIFILGLALLIAILLNANSLKGKTFFKTVTFMPYVCAAIAMGLIFRMLFDENVGIVNEILTGIGMSKIPWLTSSKFSKIPVIILNIWRNTPWFTLIILSGVLSISKDYYEAATVDGANVWQQFISITLPSLGHILFFCSVTLTVNSWKIFNESYILAGPGTSNTSLFQYMYESGFNIFKMGYASAIGTILTLILGVISFTQLVVRRKQGEI